LVTAVGAGPSARDVCEFESIRAARAFGWEASASTKAGRKTPELALVSDGAKVGGRFLVAKGVAGMGNYGGLRLRRRINLAGCSSRDNYLVFWIKQNAADGIFVNFAFPGGHIYRHVRVKRGQWQLVRLDLLRSNWRGSCREWGLASMVSFYTKPFDQPGEYLALDGLRLEFGARPKDRRVGIDFRTPVELSSWRFPQTTAKAWIIGNDTVAFAIERTTGTVIGGWNVFRRERCLNVLMAAYHWENTKETWQSTEEEDQVVRANRPSGEALELTCRNRLAPEVTIVKTYRIVNNRLERKVVLRYPGDTGDLYCTLCSRLGMPGEFRDRGNYVGSGFVGPILPAPKLAVPRRVTEYRSSSKCMMLVNYHAGYTLAHYRYAVNGHFLFPWFSKFLEPANSLWHTPDGWQIGMATLPLRPGQPVSVTEHVMIVRGDQHDFLTRHYPALKCVADAYENLKPRPNWREQVKLYMGIGSSPNAVGKVRQLIEATDEGYILVMLGAANTWCEYLTDRDLVGTFGGVVPKGWHPQIIERLHALSPRVKVGIYTWMNSVTWNAAVLKQHPEWFRPRNKAGELVNLFPGVAANYATMIAQPGCMQFLLSQYAAHLRDWNVDFIYLDGSKTTNLIDWQHNTLTQDPDWYRFYEGICEIARASERKPIVFFNGRAHPYADVNFIEARSEMRESDWRRYAGQMTCIRSFLDNDPGAFVIPLYWTGGLRTSYVNHLFGLGCRPALEPPAPYDPMRAVRKLPYVTACYELKDARSAGVRIKPDWQTDLSTPLESYVTRQGNGIILNLIHHKPPADEVVRLNARAVGFDASRPVYAFACDIAHPDKVAATVTESQARAIYAATSWSPDRITYPRPIEVRRVGDELEMRLHFAGPMAKIVCLSQVPAAVWSADNLPVNFPLPDTRGVSVSVRSAEAGNVTLKVKSSRDAAELLFWLPARRAASSLRVDGRAREWRTVCLGERFFALLALARGEHSVELAAGPARLAQQDPWLPRHGKRGKGRTGGVGAADATENITPRTPSAVGHCPRSVAAGSRLEIDVAQAPRGVAVTVVRDGRLLLADARPVVNGRVSIKVPEVLPPGPVQVQVASIAANMIGSSSVEITGRAKSLILSRAFPEPMKPVVALREVGRTIGGFRILQQATARWHDVEGGEHVAKANAEKLRLAAGSGRRFDCVLGYGYAAFELSDVRALRLRLRNTFYGAFNIRATLYHLHPYKKTPNSFAGIFIDYHTPRGYTSRVALGVGVLNADRKSRTPRWGANRKPDRFIDLGPLIEQGPKHELTLDLSRWAPAKWTGRVWLTVGAEQVAPGRTLTVELVEPLRTAGPNAVSGTDLADLARRFNKPRTVLVPRATFVPTIDGVMDEEAWREAAHIKEFLLLGGKTLPRVKTSARLFYTDEYLYVGFRCEEPERGKPLTGTGAIWRDDEVELWIDRAGKATSYLQLLVNGAGEWLVLNESGRTDCVPRVAAGVRGREWILEIALPMSAIGGPPEKGDSWRLNLCRHRPASQRFPQQLITWSALKDSFKELSSFGTAVFR